MDRSLNEIKTYPDVSQEAMRNKKAKELRVWYLLRRLDEQGGGRVDRTVAQEALSEVMSYETLRRVVNSGKGLFWEIVTCKDGRRLIELRGLEKVCVALGVRGLRRYPVIIPIEACLNIVEFKAAAFASWFTTEGSNPISRKTLKNLFDIASSTQVRYTEKADVETIKHQSPTGLIISEYVPSDMRKEGYFSQLIDGQTVLCKKLPNSYFANMQRALSGRTRKVNRSLRARHIVGWDEQRRKRYFRDPKALLRCKYRDEVSYLWIREKQIGENERIQLWEEQSWEVM